MLKIKLKSFPLIVLFFVFFFVMVTISFGSAQKVPSEWEYTVPSKVCPNGSDQCHWSSPALADFDGDGVLDIVLATNNGRIIVLKADDSDPDGHVKLLERDIASFISGMSSGEEVISSSPAVGDIDDDGHPEIVVGFGSVYTRQPTRGGMIVLEHTGQVKSGWPYFSMDDKDDGLEKSIFSSPAIGDLDNDGDLEIVVGGFDKRIYAWHHNGELVDGFPLDSHHIHRFPDWDDIVGKLADTIWSSPALADMDGDGYLDIVIGSDEGNYDDNWGGDANGWTCPYRLPAGWPPGYCGGSVYVVNRFGELLSGFPKYKLETFQSSPAIGDLDEDGSPDIVIGTGEFYYKNSPDQPTAGFKVYAWDSQGNDLPGWSGGKSMGGTVTASPSIGDIVGDKRPEVVVLANDKKLYAWHSDGNQVAGFPMTPVDHTNTPRGASVGTNFILADYDGDGKMEIFFRQAWDITVVDGDGAQLTDGDYQLNGTIFNNPAVGDIDNDGKLELVAFNSDLRVWELPSSKVNASWPMFKQNFDRVSYATWPMLQVNPSSIIFMHLDSDNSDTELDLLIQNTGPDSFDWSAAASNPQVTVLPDSGTVASETTTTVTIPTGSLGKGSYNFGTVTISGPGGDEAVAGSPESISIKVYVVDEIHNVYLPAVQR